MNTRRTVATGTDAAKAVAQPQRLSLADAILGSKELPSRIVLHGFGGIGKTTLGAQAESPFFLLSPGETGLHTLIDSRLLPKLPNIEVESWEDVTALIQELTSTEHSYRTLVIDTVDGIEKLCDDYVAKTDYAGDKSEKGFKRFQAGHKVVAAGPWRDFLCSLDKLRAAKRMRILLLAHTVVKNYKNPMGPDYDRFVPAMNKESWDVTFYWADIVLYADREPAVTDPEKGKTKGKATGELPRKFHTERTSVYDAKNRHGLPEEIEMGHSGQEAWANFVNDIKTAKQTNGEK